MAKSEKQLELFKQDLNQVWSSRDELGRLYYDVYSMKFFVYSNQGKNIKPLVKMINNIIFEIMCWKAQNERDTIRKRQAEGIASAKANKVKFGRPKTKLPDNFREI